MDIFYLLLFFVCIIVNFTVAPLLIGSVNFLTENTYSMTSIVYNLLKYMLHAVDKRLNNSTNKI